MYVATDLHGHTRFSDGRATPEAYVEHRRALGMRVVAITDHDVLTGARPGAAAASAAGMILLPAAEITAFFHFGQKAAEQVHVLAYFAPEVLAGDRLERTYLFRRGQRVQQRWRDFVLEWIGGLPRDGRDALDAGMELERLAAPEFPALQTMIDRIVARARPLYEPFRDHHARFWEGDRETFGWTPEEAIEAIRGDGAVDIVAHPARYRDKEATAALLYRASGLEVYTSRHKEDVAAKYRLFAEANGKLWTASSDDHQNARYVRPPSGSPVRTVERILRRPLPMSMILAA